jgi:hypothetical protein
MSTPENIAPEDDANLKNRELVYVAALIMVGVVFAFLILSGVMFYS